MATFRKRFGKAFEAVFVEVLQVAVVMRCFPRVTRPAY